MFFDLMQLAIETFLVLMLISGLAGYFLNRHYNKKKYKNKKRLWNLVITDSCFVLFKVFFYFFILFMVITLVIGCLIIVDMLTKHHFTKLGIDLLFKYKLDDLFNLKGTFFVMALLLILKRPTQLVLDGINCTKWFIKLKTKIYSFLEKDISNSIEAELNRTLEEISKINNQEINKEKEEMKEKKKEKSKKKKEK